MTKAIFLDIDGTLLPFDTHKISEPSLQAIQKLRQKGYKVFAATGRPKLLLEPITDIELDGYITLNGASCYLPDGTELYKDCLAKEDLQRIIEKDEELKIPFAYIEENSWFINRIDETVERLAKVFDIQIPPIRPLSYSLETEVFQLMGYFPYTQDDYIFNEVLPNSESMRWHPEFTDIIARGNNKAKAMEILCQYFGIDMKETMAFGDGGNDIEMIKTAGIGIAMGSASEQLKAQADHVTLPVEEEGVVVAMKYFGLPI